MPKSKREKVIEYEYKYGHIPKDYKERLEYLYNTLKITDNMSDQILAARQRFIDTTYYETIRLIIYEIPEFTPRPRARIITRKDMFNAITGSNDFIQIYSITGKQNKEFMRMYTKEHVQHLNQLLCTPCDIEYKTYFPTPKNYNRIDTFLAEIGCHRPIIKPDFDNIEKAYGDAFTDNIWIDDIVVVDATIRKYYSILPRVEIDLKYANQLCNYHQYKSITNRKDFTPNMHVEYFKP